MLSQFSNVFVDDFFEFEQECCLPTCKKFECSIEKGWAPWPAVADDIGASLSGCNMGQNGAEQSSHGP